AYLNEQVSGMAVVQAYAQEERAAAEFDEINSAYRNANNRSIVYDAALDAAIEMISSVCIASVLWYAGVHALSQEVTFGTLFAFIAYVEFFFVPIGVLRARNPWPQGARAGAGGVLERLENKEEACPSVPAASSAPAGDSGDSGDPAMAFELENVTFEYKPGV